MQRELGVLFLPRRRLLDGRQHRLGTDGAAAEKRAVHIASKAVYGEPPADLIQAANRLLGSLPRQQRVPVRREGIRNPSDTVKRDHDSTARAERHHR